MAGQKFDRRKIHLAYLAVIAVGVLGLGVYDGARRTGTGSGVVSVQERKSTDFNPRPESRFRVATFNIASARMDPGLDGISKSIAQSGADVTLLHEVLPGRQADQLASMTRQVWADSPSERRWWRESFGNAMLSRLTLEDDAMLRIPLPQTQERGHRNVMVARVRVGGVTVTVLGTHVDRQVDQPSQLAFLKELFLTVPEPAVLLGDMNVTINNEVVQDLILHHGVAEVGPENDRRIELILVRGMRKVDAGQIDLHASDHALVWAELEVVAAPTVPQK